MLGRIFGLAAACALFALAGCYTADHPLITDSEAATPYEKFTIFPNDDEDGGPGVFVRQGFDYVGQGGDAGLTLRFKALQEPGWYIAEMRDDSGIGLDLMYAFVVFDAEKKVALAYAMMAPGEVSTPGLSKCGGAVCIGDLSVYAAHVFERISNDEGPDMFLEVAVE